MTLGKGFFYRFILGILDDQHFSGTVSNCSNAGRYGGNRYAEGFVSIGIAIQIGWNA
jgi:hypothetical protein